MSQVIVLFEVKIKKNQSNSYLRLANNLKKELSKAEGFLYSERFSSLVTPNKLLSMSVWESEEAVKKWRNLIEHRISQQEGRDHIFESYRITVATSNREYTEKVRQNAPEDSNRFFADKKK